MPTKQEVLPILEKVNWRIDDLLGDYWDEELNLCSFYASREQKKLSVEEHCSIVKYIWSQKSENFKLLYSLLENKKHFDSIIQKLIIKLEKKEIPSIELYIFFQNHWGGFEVSKLYRYIPLNEYEQRLIWTFFAQNNPGRERSYFSHEVDQMRSRIDKLIRQSPEPVKILDLGCGANAIMLKEIKNKYGGKISYAVGLDIDISQDSYKDLPENTEIIKGKSDNVPFVDDTFDIVYSSFALYFLSEKGYSQGMLEPILSEALRVSNQYFIIAGGTPSIEENFEKARIPFIPYNDSSNTIEVDLVNRIQGKKQELIIPVEYRD